MQGRPGTLRLGRGALCALAALLIALALGATAATAQAAKLRGTITSQSGGDPFVALAGATVAVKDPGTGAVVDSDTSDVDGDYAVTVPSGTYDVEVSATGFESLLREDVEVSGNRRLDETLVATGQGRIHGIVRDAGGRPIPGFTVEFGDGGAGTIETVGAADGTFSLAAPQGSALLRISGPEAWQFRDNGLFSLGTERTLDLTVPSMVPLTVRALGVADVPVPDAAVTVPPMRIAADAGDGAVGELVTSRRNGTTDADGEFAAMVFDGAVVVSPFAGGIVVTPTVESGYGRGIVFVEDLPAISGPTEVVLHLEPLAP